MPLLTKAKQRTVISALRDSNVRDIEQNYNEPAKLWCNEKWITAACLRCSDQRCIRYIDAEISCGSFSDFPYERNLNVCPVDAIKWNFEKELPEIENGKCIGCGLCAARCPVGAIFKADNKMKVSAPESDDYIDLPINYENLVKHRKTNALLAGLAHCPHCGRRLSVIPESDRWTNGKPRFKYVCPGYRKKECNFKAVDGVLLDEFVVQQLSELSDENSERFRSILEIKIEEVLEQSQTVQEHNLIKKKRDKLKVDIAAQTRNLREADGSIKQFIQEDLQNLAEELRETEQQLSKLDEGRKNNMIAIRDLEMTKERLLSFAEYAKDAQPEVLVTFIRTIVERIYIVDKDDERYCHIFIKGCSGEDYTGFFQTAGYIEQNTVPVCDSEQHCICSKI